MSDDVREDGKVWCEECRAYATDPCPEPDRCPQCGKRLVEEVRYHWFDRGDHHEVVANLHGQNAYATHPTDKYAAATTALNRVLHVMALQNEAVRSVLTRGGSGRALIGVTLPLDQAIYVVESNPDQ